VLRVRAVSATGLQRGLDALVDALDVALSVGRGMAILGAGAVRDGRGQLCGEEAVGTVEVDDMAAAVGRLNGVEETLALLTVAHLVRDLYDGLSVHSL
jgi:hypothetical protein